MVRRKNGAVVAIQFGAGAAQTVEALEAAEDLTAGAI